MQECSAACCTPPVVHGLLSLGCGAARAHDHTGTVAISADDGSQRYGLLPCSSRISNESTCQAVRAEVRCADCHGVAPEMRIRFSVEFFDPSTSSDGRNAPSVATCDSRKYAIRIADVVADSVLPSSLDDYSGALPWVLAGPILIGYSF